jgi:hypothetical protein
MVERALCKVRSKDVSLDLGAASGLGRFAVAIGLFPKD